MFSPPITLRFGMQMSVTLAVAFAIGSLGVLETDLQYSKTPSSESNGLNYS